MWFLIIRSNETCNIIILIYTVSTLPTIDRRYHTTTKSYYTKNETTRFVTHNHMAFDFER